MTDTETNGLPGLVPYLWVMDIEAALAEYSQVFGFVESHRITAPGGRVTHAEMHYNGQLALMLGAEKLAGNGLQPPAVTRRASPVGLYIYCKDVDAFAERARQADMVFTSPVQDMPWGERSMSLRDSNGYGWTCATPPGVSASSDSPGE